MHEINGCLNELISQGSITIKNLTSRESRAVAWSG
jgi:hypothetical protein